MVERCPGCGAREPGAQNCRRCGAELVWLTRIQAAGQRAERQAVQALARGDRIQALQHATHALRLKRTVTARALAEVAIRESTSHSPSPA